MPWINKWRSDADGTVERVEIIGKEAVVGRDIVLLDDIVDTAGTTCAGALALMEAGANSVSVYATHGVFSGPAVQRLEQTPEIRWVKVTDSIPPSPAVAACSKISFLPNTKAFADEIKATHDLSQLTPFSPRDTASGVQLLQRMSMPGSRRLAVTGPRSP
jgi:ribose-phosphate pyrophosphokinase